MLEKFFSSKTRVKLLMLFMNHPKRQYYLREISKMLGESTTPIRRELINLKKVGLLKRSKVANIIYYDVNRNFLLYQELKGMVEKTGEQKTPEEKSEQPKNNNTNRGIFDSNSDTNQ